MIKTIALLLAGCLVASAEVSSTLDRRNIAGGSTATVYDYPFVVLLVADTNPVRTCTGTLISDTWALTAAHCVDGVEVGEYSFDSKLLVVHGYPWTTETRHATEAIIHADYDPLEDFEDWGRDIALIRLSEKFLSRTAVSVELGDDIDSLFLQTGVMVTAVGWGGPDPNTVNAMTASEWPLSVCGEGSELHLCTDPVPDGHHAENGDSGGPLLLAVDDEWVQVGIHSSVDESGVTRHVKVAEHRQWIDDALEGKLAPENACASDPETPPPPPAAPPPFQPQPVEVALGASGQSITLMTTEAGGFTLNGEAIASGAIHQAANGRYVLQLSGTTWTARFLPEVVQVVLGASGQSVTLTQMEAGGYGIDGTAIESGHTYIAANGNYTLTMADGVWTAAFDPMMHEISLGTSGDSVTIVQMEAGGYSLNGEPITANTVVTAANGTQYRIAPDDGQWTATLVP